MLGTSQTRTGDGGTGHSAVQHSPAAKPPPRPPRRQATSESSAAATEASATTAEAPTKASAAGTAEASAAAAAEGASETTAAANPRHVILRSADGCRRRSRQIHRGHLVLWALSDLRAVAAADGANGAGTSRIPDHARRG